MASKSELIIPKPDHKSSHIPMDPRKMVSEYERDPNCKDDRSDSANQNRENKNDSANQNGRKKYSLYPFSTSEYLNRIKTAKFLEDDVLIAGYPKTGQTLMEAIVTLVLHDGDVQQLNNNYNFLRTNFLDAYDSEKENGIVRVRANQARPRTMRTHLPAHMLPYDIPKQQIKTIYTVRDLKDTMVSLFHFCRSYKQLGTFDGDWNDFFEIVMSGDIPYGHAADHYLSWWRMRRRLNVLFVTYEEMVNKRANCVRKIARFLGKKLDNAQVDNIVNATSFQSMRGNDKVNFAPLSMAIDQSISPFIRKGIVGDWKNHFSSEQAREFDAQFHCQTVEVSTMLKGLL